MRGGYNHCLTQIYSETEKYAMSWCDKAFSKSVLNRLDFDLLFDKIDRYAFFCIAYREDVIGYAAMYANDSQTKVAYITLIGVCQDWQNCGIGSSLMEWCVRIAKSRGMESIKLEVARDNINAQKFYKKHGFVITDDCMIESFFMIKNLE